MAEVAYRKRIILYFECYVFQSFRVLLKDFLSVAEFLARKVPIYPIRNLMQGDSL